MRAFITMFTSISYLKISKTYVSSTAFYQRNLPTQFTHPIYLRGLFRAGLTDLDR